MVFGYLWVFVSMVGGIEERGAEIWKMKEGRRDGGGGGAIYASRDKTCV